MSRPAPATAHDRYGSLLVLVVGAIVFGMAAPDSGWVQAVAIGLQAVVLLVALRTAAASARAVRISLVALAILVAGGVGWTVGDLPSASGLGAIAGFVLVLVAMSAIAKRLFALGALDARTVLGAWCIYLLVGIAFAFAFLAIAAFDSAPLFRDGTDPTLSRVQYFSFVTLTTVGYGDLAPATSLGRSMAILEALVGQIYLVTVIALLVGNLRLPGRQARGQAVTRPDEQ